jgi:broad specificity phosphatase PhoE
VRPGTRRAGVDARGKIRLSTLYLVRHGQAGTRDAYDSLSELGRKQARLLGEHLVSMAVSFARVYSGDLTRQRQTAEQIRMAYSDAHVSFPIGASDSGWNEFDLAQVSRELASPLCAADPDFRRDYEQMLEQVRISNGEHATRVHRKWLPCDTKLVEAWIRGRFPYGGETWREFYERVVACRSRIGDPQIRENILVVTSATPIAIWTGLSLDICDERIMQLAGALHNTSYTILRLRQEHLRLFTFNAAPHLSPPGLLTHR